MSTYIPLYYAYVITYPYPKHDTLKENIPSRVVRVGRSFAGIRRRIPTPDASKWSPDSHHQTSGCFPFIPYLLMEQTKSDVNKSSCIITTWCTMQYHVVVDHIVFYVIHSQVRYKSFSLSVTFCDWFRHRHTWPNMQKSNINIINHFIALTCNKIPTSTLIHIWYLKSKTTSFKLFLKSWISNCCCIYNQTLVWKWLAASISLLEHLGFYKIQSNITSYCLSHNFEIGGYKVILIHKRHPISLPLGGYQRKHDQHKTLVLPRLKSYVSNVLIAGKVPK